MVQKLKKSIWDANGRHFGRTKPPMVDFDGLQNALWMDLGGILGGFGMGFGWVWGSLDASWLMFDLLFGRVCPKGATGTPALPRYAPRSVTILQRGLLGEFVRGLPDVRCLFKDDQASQDG